MFSIEKEYKDIPEAKGGLLTTKIELINVFDLQNQNMTRIPANKTVLILEVAVVKDSKSIMEEVAIKFLYEEKIYVYATYQFTEEFELHITK